MKAFSKKYLILFILTIIASTHVLAQESVFSCQNTTYEYLKTLIGNWKVTTKDRTSPGNYEKNTGNSEISNLIIGCGIKESFRGVYKNKPYAREVMITGKDSTAIAMSIIDSEHNSFSILNGTIHNKKVVVYWYRNKEVKKLQSKYILTIEDQNRFEFSSYLSTDHGKNWALTHERKYTRIHTH